MSFPPAPTPKSLLGYYRLLSPTAAVRVSPLCLGTMNFGDAWKGMMGECDKQTSFEILDFYFEQGGNFIDTANLYQGGESEEWLGEWMASRKCRDEIVLASKYTAPWPSPKSGVKILANFQGNHAKSLRLSLDESLRRLQTTYLDLLYVHWWDFTTSIPELMQTLNRMIDSGKVLYLGVSDTPAWVVVKANEYARSHGLTQFSVYQGKWNASARDIERDILPMCEAEGMGIAPWGILARGMFSSDLKDDADKAGKGASGYGLTTDRDKKIAEKVQAIAKEKQTLPTSIAIAYLMHKYPYVYPIVGGRKVEHLKSNIEALSIQLSDAEVSEIEGAAEFDIGFPMNMLFGFFDPSFQYSSRMTSSDVNLLKNAFHLDTPEKPRQATPHKSL